jgi:hypothetical protein
MTRARCIAAEGIGCSATDTFAGIRPADAPGFIMAQLAVATALFRWLVPSLPKDAVDVVVSHRMEQQAS